MPFRSSKRSATGRRMQVVSRSIPWSQPVASRIHASVKTPTSDRRTARSSSVNPFQNTEARALTVFQSPTISEFGIEILGDIPQGGIAGTNLIFGRAFGEIIDRLGGVPAGASGSPVYVEDRLIGAVAFTLEDPLLVGITPIEAMRAIRSEHHANENAALNGAFDRIEGSAGTNYALPVVSGLKTPKALLKLEERYGIKLSSSPPGRSATGGLPSEAAAPTPLVPGGPLGTALITGDISLGFIGTVTEVQDDGDILAFGHPLLFSGPTQLALTDATILATGRNQCLGNSKVGALGKTIGTVVQDRSAGVLAQLDQTPKLLPLNLTVTDNDRNMTRTLAVEIAPLPSEVSFLTFLAADEAFARTMDRVGSGTARWKWTVKVAELENAIEQSGDTFDLYDIGAAVAGSIFSLVDPLLEQGLTVVGIELTAEVERKAD